MTKDPAFLFYSKDWISETSEMKADEKGVFADLIVHQHQKGSVPAEPERLALLVRMGLDEFLKIWQSISYKFVAIDNIDVRPSVNRSVDLPLDKSVGRLVNPFYHDVFNERSTKGHINKIIGTFASIIRLRVRDENLKKEVKKVFNPKDFETIPPTQLTERLTKWLYERFPILVNANVNANENGNKNKKNGVEETNGNGHVQIAVIPPSEEVDQYAPEIVNGMDSFNGSDLELAEYLHQYPKELEVPTPQWASDNVAVVPEMIRVFKRYHTSYVEQKEKDAPACRKIAQLLAEKENVRLDEMNAVFRLKNVWEPIVVFVRQHPHFKIYNLAQIERYIQSILTAMEEKDKPASNNTGGVKVSTLQNNLQVGQGAQEILRKMHDQL